MRMAESKIFRHQSGLIQAVRSDLEDVLEATRLMVEKVKSDPPPRESLHPVDPGIYSLSSTEHPSLTEVVSLPGNLALRLSSKR